MNFATKIYLTLISVIGVLFFINLFDVVSFTLSQLPFIFILTGAVLLLNHFIIALPPNGNALSMDSAIYLACIYLFGIDTTLLVLLLSSILGGIIFNRRSQWWKHLFNFSFYVIMIVVSYYIFISLGGIPGDVNFTHILPYFVSLSIYFLLNIFLIWLVFYLMEPLSFHMVLKSVISKRILIESLVSYVSTLLLAFVLTILLKEEPYVGLFLFTVFISLLSFVFNKFFKLYQEVEEKSKIDFLTNLPNHGYFKQKLDEHIATLDEDGIFSLALIDIDDFKKYNDLNGHLQGDELIKFIGHFLKEKTEEKGFLAARYGGEEFTVIMPNTKKREALTFLNKIRKELNDTPFIGVEDLPLNCLSFSGGVVEYTEETYNSAEMLNKADKAMYYAKAQGKNSVQVYEGDKNIFTKDNLFKDIERLEQKLSIFLSKDMYTYQHSKRVFRYAVDMSERLSLSLEEQRQLILGSLIHDIGKLEIPRDIINKKGKLTTHEWDLMKKHVTWGKEIIASHKKYEDLIPIVELHHERYDGKGYPFGLSGERIPKLARILCIIDSFDAMTTERPYQETKTFNAAIKELRVCSGTQFDPQYIVPFINMIQEKYPDKLDGQKTDKN